MKVVETISDVRRQVNAAKSAGKRIGFVPTMGALHIGHISLIERSVAECDYTIVSIFVNPTQFGPSEDFEKYPRPIEKDLKICEDNGVDVVFAPSVSEIYPSRNLTWVEVEKLTEPLCGSFRPGHFRGVATVCAKLFNIVRPDVACFGQKDAQQAIVIKKMVADLNMPLEIVVCPTVREKSGLAVSSRNEYLSAKQRKDAAVIYKSLQRAEFLIKSGEKDADKITGGMKTVLNQVGELQLEYADVVDAETLEKLERIGGKVLVAVAARLGPTRLIDNILVDTAGR
jgi:pantoate--beta-alanine ligase